MSMLQIPENCVTINKDMFIAKKMSTKNNQVEKKETPVQSSGITTTKPTNKSEVFQAFLESFKENEEVYRRLADS